MGGVNSLNQNSSLEKGIRLGKVTGKERPGSETQGGLWRGSGKKHNMEKQRKAGHAPGITGRTEIVWRNGMHGQNT